MENKREVGYYWCKWGNSWHICYFEEFNVWKCIDTEDIFLDADFDEIDETQITRDK